MKRFTGVVKIMADVFIHCETAEEALKCLTENWNEFIIKDGQIIEAKILYEEDIA